MMNANTDSQRWHSLADRVLEGVSLTAADGLAMLRCDDAELLDLLAAAYRVRRHWCGNRVYLNYLINAKSGLCSEDCGYCSQSRVSQADIPRYRLIEFDEILAGARQAAQRGAGTYCIVISGRSPSGPELDRIADAVSQIKGECGLHICVSVGLMTPEQVRQIKAAGADRMNHNLNTSRRFYPKICTTHSYDDRLATLRTARESGLELCCGGIVGMGEDDEDVVDLALQIGQLRPEAVPINFLIPIPGTPTASIRQLNPRYCLKALCLFRMANPRGELRIAGGRELHLGSLQPLGLYPANSMFVGDYLTTHGQPPSEDYRMIEALGFDIVWEGTGSPVRLDASEA
jgi:biotin synthase